MRWSPAFAGVTKNGQSREHPPLTSILSPLGEEANARSMYSICRYAGNSSSAITMASSRPFRAG